MPDAIVARVLRLPGCGVSRWEADEPTATLTLWVRRHGAVYACGGCGRWRRDVYSGRERRVRDLPWGTWAVWLVVDVHRVRCRRCGVRTERIPWLAGKARYTSRFEAAVAAECEQAPVSRVAARWGLPSETVRQLDKRVLRRWAARRPRPPRRYLGVDELFVGREVQFLTVVSDLESGEPIWMGRERKRETLDQFFAARLPPRRRRAVRAVCVDMWGPFRLSLKTHLPHARLVYDKECAAAHSLSYGECSEMCRAAAVPAERYRKLEDSGSGSAT